MSFNIFRFFKTAYKKTDAALGPVNHFLDELNGELDALNENLKKVREERRKKYEEELRNALQASSDEFDSIFNPQKNSDNTKKR